MRDLYLEQLRLWQQGEEKLAAERVFDHWLVYSHYSGWNITARNLVQSDPELLLPVFRLHLGAYDLAVERGDRKLARFSRAFLKGLVQLYLKHDPSEAGRAQGARVWLAISRKSLNLGHLVRPTGSKDNSVQRRFLAQDALRQALKVHPESRAVPLMMASIEEKLGRYKRASQWLQRYLALEADDEVAQLRLALCLDRGGQTDRASTIESLLALARSDGEDWVRRLAFHEAVRRTPWKDSLELIHEARQHYPDDPTLELLELRARDDRSLASRVLLGHLEESSDGTVAQSNVELSTQQLLATPDQAPRVHYNLVPLLFVQELNRFRLASEAQLEPLIEVFTRDLSEEQSHAQ